MGTSLIPIKGISQAQKRNLANNCKIYDIAGLLANGRTPEQRKVLAGKLNVDRRFVDIWVKQADLWRVEGMTEDYAYLLVLAGIRGVQDLAKIDVLTTKAVLKSISNTHPDFKYDEDLLSVLKTNAEMLCPSAHAGHNLELIIKALGSDTRGKNELSNFFNAFRDKMDETGVVFEDDEPTHLFGRDYVLEVLDERSESEIINEGLNSLRDINISLPLPRTLMGKVSYRDIGETHSRETVNVANLLVEVRGIICPEIDSGENNDVLTAYTDGNGIFNITLPDRYSMQECINFTFSKGGNKQSFNILATDIVTNAEVRNSTVRITNEELLNAFEEIDNCNNVINLYKFNLGIIRIIQDLESEEDELEEKHMERNEDRIQLINKLYSKIEILNIDDDATEIINQHIKDAGSREIRKYLEYEIEKSKKNRKSNIVRIFGTDPTKQEAEKKVPYLMSLIEMTWKYGIDDDDGFVIIREVFENHKEDYAKALPSVKLLGEGEGAVWLPTDKAPSRTYSYSLLQRLVEPAVDPPAYKDGNTAKQRIKMCEPADVSRFRKDFGENPDSYPKMSSLGIGYSLNMQQAWVPDGYALGELLYSVILAPGEEQRLIVRENKSAYGISDDIDAQDYTESMQSQEQTDDIQALYDYALGQQMNGGTSMNYSTQSTTVSASAGGSYCGFGGSISASHSRSSGKSGTKSSQTNTHNEASEAAQQFNQKFTVAASLYERAKRVNIRSATSDESDSVATKIIANHNHSHAMTIQYWEVVRRYRLETSIRGIDLVLFVPFKPIRFLPVNEIVNLSYNGDFTGESSTTGKEKLDKNRFDHRYEEILRHFNAIYKVIPYAYRRGLNLIQEYAALPYFEVDKVPQGSEDETYKITVTGNFLEFDNLSATLEFNNGCRQVYGRLVSYTTSELQLGSYDFKALDKAYTHISYPHTRKEVTQAIILCRNKNVNEGNTAVFEFVLPYGTSRDNIKRITIRNSIQDGWDYRLSQRDADQTPSELEAMENYEKYKKEMVDDKTSIFDLFRKAGRFQFEENLPEWFWKPVATFSSNELFNTGILKVNVTEDGTGTLLENQAVLSRWGLSHEFGNQCPRLSVRDMQDMEKTFHHIISNSLFYSKAIWQQMSTDELAMMLEKYTVDMDFDKYYDLSDTSETNIPLLNCINVKKPLGIYGNCMLFPFTYPEKLARKLGKTAGEIQDSLYRYHTSNFRSPSTVISVPTEGMIGEAVLSSTNVSEKIDVTRFWNWKDSPIDTMNIDSSYLNGTDYLAGKDTKDISALNLKTADLQTPVTTADLVSALVAKQTPTFDNITGLEQAAAILGQATTATAAGRDKALQASSDMTRSAISAASDIAKTAAGKAASATNKVGDLDNLKSNLKDFGLSDNKVKELAGKMSTGEMSYSDAFAAALKAKDEGTSTATTNTTYAGSLSTGEAAGNTGMSSAFSEILKYATKAIESGKTPVEMFNDWMLEKTGEDKEYTEEEIRKIAERYCKANGTTIDAVVSLINELCND